MRIEDRMDSLRDMLAAKASAVIPGTSYNAFRAQREDEAAAGMAPLFFESALPTSGAEAALANKVMPSLMQFIERKQQSLERPDNVLVALFLAETCFVLPADAVIDVFCETEGVNRQALRSRLSSWLGAP
jgi:hypothetical protein